MVLPVVGAGRGRESALQRYESRLRFGRRQYVRSRSRRDRTPCSPPPNGRTARRPPRRLVRFGRARASVPAMSSVALAEELLLLAYDDDSGRATGSTIGLDLGMAAAVLLELALAGR